MCRGGKYIFQFQKMQKMKKIQYVSNLCTICSNVFSDVSWIHVKNSVFFTGIDEKFLPGFWTYDIFHLKGKFFSNLNFLTQWWFFSSVETLHPNRTLILPRIWSNSLFSHRNSNLILNLAHLKFSSYIPGNMIVKKITQNVLFFFL